MDLTSIDVRYVDPENLADELYDGVYSQFKQSKARSFSYFLREKHTQNDLIAEKLDHIILLLEPSELILNLIELPPEFHEKDVGLWLDRESGDFFRSMQNLFFHSFYNAIIDRLIYIKGLEDDLF